MIVTPRFYDVPMFNDITAPRFVGSRRVGGKMPYAIFDTKREAEDFAKSKGLLVNYRDWDDTIFSSALIIDNRKESSK